MKFPQVDVDCVVSRFDTDMPTDELDKVVQIHCRLPWTPDAAELADGGASLHTAVSTITHDTVQNQVRQRLTKSLLTLSSLIQWFESQMFEVPEIYEPTPTVLSPPLRG